MRIVWQLGMLAGIVLAAAVAQGAQSADPFYQGLEQRGLRTLMEEYLRQQSGAGPAAAPGEQVNKLALARLQVQKALEAENMAARDSAFREARTFYEGAVADLGKALIAVPADRVAKRNEVRLDLINTRLELANMIFQKWLKTDLDMLEVTDRRAGDRARATELLRTANEQYKATLEEIQVWLSALDQLVPDERLKIINKGHRRRVTNAKRDAEYSNAWITFYYGWILPSDYKPKKGERKRSELLDDAITACQQYTAMPDRVSAKWYAYLVIGMAYRELGKFEEALQSLALADGANVPEADAAALKIRVAFERARTLIRQGEIKKARDALDAAEKVWKEKLNTNLYGLAFPMLRGESLILEGKEKGNQAEKDEGTKILREVHKRGNPWPYLVEPVLSDLIGEQSLDAQDPFMIWIKANDALAAAQEKTDPDQLKEAETLFKAYADKVGEKDPKYPAALYSRAACLLQLGQKAEAADLFQKVADTAPTYQYAAAAARYAVSVRGEVYEKSPSDETRTAYEDALRWFVAKWLQTDPDQQYYYALVLYRGKKFVDAGDAFARVPEKAEHFPDSKFWVALCRLEHFRDKTLPTHDKQLILTGARTVAQGLLVYAEYAFTAQAAAIPDEKKKQLMAWAESAYINAADIYLYPEVELPADALPVLDTVEQKFKLSEDSLGNVLKLRIDGLQKLGRLDEAQQVLSKFLQIAKPAQVGPVLRGLFRALIDDVRELVKRDQKPLAAVKVEQAKALGDRFNEWLEKSTLADKAFQIENGRYDLAELYLAVGNYTGALQIYQEIAGPKPHQPEKDQPMKEDCVYGQARAFQGMGDSAPDTAQAKPQYEAALERWRALLTIPIAEPQDRWEREYNLYYCKYKLGDKKEVLDSLKALEVIRPPLGGKDPTLQKKYAELKAAAATG